nr:hypothetical protein CFP56_03000 [Quercus suber]
MSAARSSKERGRVQSCRAVLPRDREPVVVCFRSSADVEDVVYVEPGGCGMQSASVWSHSSNVCQGQMRRRPEQ